MIQPKSLRFILTASCAAVFASLAVAANTNPSVRQSVNPTYPQALWDKGIEGRTLLKVGITDTGDVESVEVVSADDPAFGTAAVEAVKKWKFNPATVDGKPVRKTVQLPIEFAMPFVEKFNKTEGRDVFKKITDTIVAEDRLDHPLKIVKPPVAYWPPNVVGDAESVQIAMRVIVGPTGEIFNPEVPDKTPVALLVPLVKAASEMTYEPPVYEGKPVYTATEAIIVFVDAPPPPAAAAPAPAQGAAK